MAEQTPEERLAGCSIHPRGTNMNPSEKHIYAEYNLAKVKELQAEEAKLRRENLSIKYNITPEETVVFKNKLREALAGLGESVNPDDIVNALDGAFSRDVTREMEIRNALTDSLLGKISESIKYYMSEEANIGLLPLLDGISSQLHNNERKFNSISDVHNELKKYEPILKKYNLNFDNLSKQFLDELNVYLG